MILMAVTSSFILRLFASGNYLRNYQRCRRLFKGYEACLLCGNSPSSSTIYIVVYAVRSTILDYTTIPLC